MVLYTSRESSTSVQEIKIFTFGLWRRKADGIGESFKRPYFLRTRPRHSFFVLLADDWSLFSLHEYVTCRSI